MVFNNVYKTTGTWTPTVTKELTGRDWREGETFEFSLTCTNWPGDGETYKPVIPENITVDKANSEKGVSFHAVTFTAPGVYTFTLTETKEGEGLGSGNRTPDITLTVTAEDDNNGNLTLTVTADGGTTLPTGSELGTAGSDVKSTIHFVNAYSDSGEFALAIAKTLTGKDWEEDDRFDFTVETQVWNGSNWEAYSGDSLTLPSGFDSFAVSVGDTVDGQTRTHSLGKIQVGNLKGNETVYRFTITEKTEDFERKNLYCAQPTVYVTVTVTPKVTEPGDTIVATYAYLETGGPVGNLTGNPLTIPFTNRYYAGGAPGDIGSSLTIGKRLEGRDWLAGESYTVEVAWDANSTGGIKNVQYDAGEGKYAEFPASMTHEFKSESGGKTDPDDWKLNFRFFEAGDYVFTVKEQIPTTLNAGVTCDPAEYTVTFHVEKEPTQSNRLVVSRSISPDPMTSDTADVVFVNEYEPTAATWTPTVKKELNGRAWAANDSFLFKLVLTGGEEDGVSLGSTEVAVTNKTAGESGVSFDAVTFTKVGTYSFTITEELPADSGITAAKASYDINAEVTDDPNTGELSVKITPADTVTGSVSGKAVTTTTTFVNTYELESATFTLAIRKTLEGRDWKTDESFSFTITPDDGYEDSLEFPTSWTKSDDSYIFSVSNVEGGATATLTLASVTVKQPGQYVFTIRETEKPGADTYCPEPEIVLTVNAVQITENGVPTGKMQVITTYAYSGGGSLGGDVDGTTTVPFVNHAYAERSFTLHKTLDGREWGESEEFHAEVELTGAALTGEVGPNGQAIYDGVPLAVGGAVTVPLKNDDGTAAKFRFLAAGTYTFQVTEVHGRLSGVTYDNSVYTVTVTVMAGADGTLSAGEAAIEKEGVPAGAIEFVNDYDPVPITGGLTVRKAVVGANKPFTFTVTLDDASVTGDFGGMHFDCGVAKLTLSADQVVTAAGLPAGVSYKVTEEPVPGYNAEATGDTGVIPEEGTAAAHFTNIQEGVEPPEPVDDNGGLTISTYVTGIGDKKKEWHFTVTLSTRARAGVDGTFRTMSFHEDTGSMEAGELTFTNGEANVMLEHGWHITIYDLPPETEYVVREKEAGQDGYSTSTVHTRGTIPHHGIADAVIVNDLEPEDVPAGTLTVSKTVAGNAGESGKPFSFTMTLEDDKGNPVSGTFNGAVFTDGQYVFSLKHGEHRTFTGLPAGYTYKVTETGAEGYTITYTNAEGVILENTAVTASFTNTKNSTPRTGNGFLTVTKTVTGNAGEHEREFAFTVTLSQTLTDGTFSGGVATFTLADGESRTFELPAGTFYTVTEAAAGDYTTTSTGASGFVPAGGTAVAAFINNRELSTGDLTVTKTVSGAQSDRDREWRFRVELGRPLTGHFGDMDFDNGVAEFTLKHGRSITATDLPAEIPFTVTEIDANSGNYITSSEGETGLIPANDTALAAFVNEWRPAPPPPQSRRGGLTVSKTVAGDGGDYGRAWSFRVELDRAINGSYGGMSFTNGVAEFTLKHGESVTARDLPAGAGYTVTEAEADTEGYTTSATGASGAIPDGGTAQAAFTNAKDEVTPDDPPDTTPPDTSPDDPSDTRPENPPDEPPGTLPDGTADVPPDDSPRTGDDSRLSLWLTLMVLSLTGITVMSIPVFRNRRFISLKGRHRKR